MLFKNDIKLTKLQMKILNLYNIDYNVRNIYELFNKVDKKIQHYYNDKKLPKEYKYAVCKTLNDLMREILNQNK